MRQPLLLTFTKPLPCEMHPKIRHKTKHARQYLPSVFCKQKAYFFASLMSVRTAPGSPETETLPVV